MGAWIETCQMARSRWSMSVAPSWARGLKRRTGRGYRRSRRVAPSWARGLKLAGPLWEDGGSRRAFMGAWIETSVMPRPARARLVAPSWARGLKLPPDLPFAGGRGVAPSWARGLKRIPASIAVDAPLVAPSWARGLKRAPTPGFSSSAIVAPSWARGLKLGEHATTQHQRCRAFMGAWIETSRRSGQPLRSARSRLHGRVD